MRKIAGGDLEVEGACFKQNDRGWVREGGCSEEVTSAEA